MMQQQTDNDERREEMKAMKGWVVYENEYSVSLMEQRQMVMNMIIHTMQGIEIW